MSEKWTQHIGDDQLIHGLPKHMAATTEESGRSFWQYAPKPGACEKCRAMAGLTFDTKPGPVHPNCKCEIRQHTVPDVTIYGILQGYEDHATEKFGPNQKITVTIRNLGPFPAGVTLCVDQEEWDQTGMLYPTQKMEFAFTKFSDLPVPWEVFLLYTMGDNSTVQYFIK